VAARESAQPAGAAAEDRPAAGSRRLRGGIAVAALLALALADVPHLGPLRTFAALVYARLAHWHDYERALSTPGAGLDILPASITGAAALLHEQHAERYRLSAQIANDGFLHQRISEVTWPAQIDPQAKFVLRLEGEPEVCTPVATANGVALDHCD
jgi:hypothetical protein